MPSQKDIDAGRRKHEKRMARIQNAPADTFRYVASDGSVHAEEQRCEKYRRRKERLEEFGYENRRALTPGEQAMANVLKDLNWRFNVEHPFRSYIFDFYVAAHRMVIEVDGGYHNTPEQSARDKIRDKELVRRGFKVVRLSNEQVIEFPRRAKATILSRIQESNSAKVLRCVLPSKASVQEISDKAVKSIVVRSML